MQIKNSDSEAIVFNFCRRLESAEISSKVKHFVANFLKIMPELIFYLRNKDGSFIIIKFNYTQIPLH